MIFFHIASWTLVCLESRSLSFRLNLSIMGVRMSYLPETTKTTPAGDLQPDAALRHTFPANKKTSEISAKTSPDPHRLYRSGRDLPRLPKDVGIALAAIAAFSCLINLLALTGPLFMLQVYDRVVPARALATLTALLILAVGLYAVFGILDILRTRLMTRVASMMDTSLSERVFAAIANAPLRGKAAGDALRPAHELDQIRTFLSGAGPLALFDLPWMPVYLAICFLLHPLIGWLTAAGMSLLIGLTLATDFKTRGLTKDAAAAGAKRNALGQSAHRSAESIAAMGMAPHMTDRWNAEHALYTTMQQRTSDIGGTFSGASKAFRYMLQSAALGAGAYLAVIGDISAGMIFAASIIVARTLAPIEQIIGNWKAMLAAWQAWQRLSGLLATLPAQTEKTSLPPPSKLLSVEGVFASPPGERRQVLKNVTFHAKAGTVVGILGASASGKSSLARALVGVWPIANGRISLDGASLDQWPTTALGRHIGYMPQAVDLFPGTVAENIARLDPDAEDADIIAAAQAAGVHDMIVALPEGYGFRVNEGGANLSAGQRQRIALARALYGNPFLVVLDEPNSNLDTDGDKALAEAIAGVRSRGGIAIVVAHRKNVLSLLDYVLVMESGMARAFGPTDAVLKALEKHAARHTRNPAGPALTVVEGESA